MPSRVPGRPIPGDNPYELTEREWEIVHAVYIEGVTYKDAATRYCVTESTIRTTIHIARRKMDCVGQKVSYVELVMKLQEGGYITKTRALMVAQTPEYDSEEGPLPASWKAYLRAFDRLVQTPEQKAPRRAVEMRIMFVAAAIDQGGLPRPRRAHPYDTGQEKGLTLRGVLPHADLYASTSSFRPAFS